MSAVSRRWVLSRGALTCLCGATIPAGSWALFGTAGWRKTVRCEACAAQDGLTPPDQGATAA